MVEIDQYGRQEVILYKMVKHSCHLGHEGEKWSKNGLECLEEGSCHGSEGRVQESGDLR